MYSMNRSSAFLGLILSAIVAAGASFGVWSWLGKPVAMPDVPKPEDLPSALVLGRASPIVVADAVLADLERASHLAPETFDTMSNDIRRFARYCEIGLGRRSRSEEHTSELQSH